jgi:NAD(P)-dependent dehydrogenase (short-subunit alcohol dehydrogenase family)
MTLTTGLEGRVAVVTGAASGIGRAVANALIAEGSRVVAVDRDDTALVQVDGVVAVREDLTDPEAPARVVAVAAEHGGPDVLVCNAGVGYATTTTETTLAQWEDTFAVNVRAPFLLCREAIPAMLARGGGTIVNVASAAAITAVPSRAAYCASKAAVIGLTRSIAVDYAARGIRANCVAPGTIDTPWVDRIVAGAPDADARRAAMAERQIVGRLGTAEEVAEAIVFLASERASFVHGSVLVVDGGMTAR